LSGTLNWYDFVVIAALLYGVWSGLRAGLSGEIIRVIGLVLMIVLAIELYLPFGNWIHAHSGMSGELAYLIAFLVIAVVVHLTALSARLATHKQMQKLKLAAMVENVGGSFAGVVRMVVIMTWLTVLLCLSNSDFWRYTASKESRFGAFVVNRIPVIHNLVKESGPRKPSWLSDLKRPPDPDFEQTGSTNTQTSKTGH